MLLYVAGQYGPKTNGIPTEELDAFLKTPEAQKGKDENIAKARAVAIQLWEIGHAVICPHLNTAHMERDCKIGHADYLRGDFQMIARCDGIVMIEGWEQSKGANMEHEYAKSLGMPVWYQRPSLYVLETEYNIDPSSLPELHITEQRCPEQVKAFAETIGKMHRTHLAKNADYSPSNILLTGEVGLATRLWDKIARILNLTGFQLIVNLGRFVGSREPMNEALDDAYLDSAVYSIIGLLLRQGKWGR